MEYIMRYWSKVLLLSLIGFILMVFTVVDGIWNISQAQNHGQVSGRLITSSGPVPAGTLAFFNADKGSDPADSSILRIPERTALVDEQGRFEVKVQYGRYLLGYFPGQQKVHPGLPDKNFEALLAGINVSKRYTLYVADPQFDTGDIYFFPFAEATASSSFTVNGNVKNKSGKPVAGITIIAKTDINSMRPQYISRQTDRSGNYTLTLPPGSYYLFARHRLKRFGRPKKGEYFGIWGVNGGAGEFGWFPIKKGQDVSMHGEAGQEIMDANITVFRIPDPVAQEELLKSGGKL